MLTFIIFVFRTNLCVTTCVEQFFETILSQEKCMRLLILNWIRTSYLSWLFSQLRFKSLIGSSYAIIFYLQRISKILFRIEEIVRYDILKDFLFLLNVLFGGGERKKMTNYLATIVNFLWRIQRGKQKRDGENGVERA